MLGSPILYLKAMRILMFPTSWLLPKPESHPNPDPILGHRNPPNEVAQNSHVPFLKSFSGGGGGPSCLWFRGIFA